MDPIKLTTTLAEYGWPAVSATVIVLCSIIAAVLWNHHLADQARLVLAQDKLSAAETARRLDLIQELEKRAAMEQRFTETLAMIAATTRAQLENSSALVKYITGSRP